MPDVIEDITFLTELIRLIDATPGDRVAGVDVAEALGQPDADVEPNVQRLKNRGLIDWGPGPFRMGDGWTRRALSVTSEGYRHDGTGLTR